MTVESRVTDLEMRYTHLQKVVDDLGEVLLEQSKQLEALQRQLQQLTSRTSDLEGHVEQPRRLEDDRPPHY